MQVGSVKKGWRCVKKRTTVSCSRNIFIFQCVGTYMITALVFQISAGISIFP